ncbi:LuxR C-terminal-related transcriptional regulator [Amycolatopsis sp. FBCC-B4732]|uniref:LuxR C-terminal-related transcriptional regulator n=1 Tax=Amycolatopsis sp. FBCC-B4732 TaxID=3079339 RepID=UPI001FF355C1|nr:LuxR C-terminal-related transcriptional regulator [Amycolatopsis sp. FBCC-B4732]UOX90859.1 LuxR C-terminal-related transcriptional regulator [Amycolatopsis sp. FBCC-B4732]
MNPRQEVSARRRVPATKVSIPVPRGDRVSRPRLFALLDDARDAAMVFVGAPAGFGKTTLLAGWARQRGRGAVAWLTADADDNDDRRFWSAVLEALGGCLPVPAASPLRHLAVPPEPGTDLAFLAQVADALDALAQPVLLVLDSAQEITSPRTWHGLQTLLRHQPAGLRLAVSSRREPPLPLVRARLADRLVDIGADRLRFSAAEATAFVETTGPRIPADQISLLVARTEGWPAGLRLATASAAKHGSLRDFFAGRDQAVLDYLTDEVLAPLTDAQQDLVRAMSVCDEVPAGLAAALTGRPDAEVVLRELGEPALQVVRSAGTPPVHQLPSLLRTYLRAELLRRAPDRTRTLHAAAARWFADSDRPALALLHSIRSGNTTRVGDLLHRHAVSLFLGGDHRVLRLALAVLDDRRVPADPLPALVSAALCLETGETSTAGLQLARAEAAWPDRPSAELTVLRQLAYSRLAQLDRSPAQAVRAAEQIDESLAAGTPLAGLATLHRAGTLVARHGNGAAREAVVRVLGAAEEQGQDFTITQCLTVLGGLAGFDGDYQVMETLARRAESRQPIHDPQRSLPAAQVGAMLAYGALLRGEPADCVDQAKRIGRLLGAAPARAARNLRLFAETLHGAAEFELGGWHAGLRRMRRARAHLGAGRACPPEHAALCAVLEHRAALRLGAAGQARETVRWAQPLLTGSGELLLLRARTQLRLGRHSAASSVLRSLADGETPLLLPWVAIEASLIGIQAALAAGAPERAARLLGSALRAAEPAGVRFPLVFAPPDVLEFLTSRLGGFGTSERFAGEVLALRRRLSTPAIPAPLTERERSVLRLLPTQRSIDEIAEDLTVSPNTVKTHVRGIYAKLHVRSRRDAVAIALQRGLLDTDVTDFTV